MASRSCGQCGRAFDVGAWEHRNYEQKFCSTDCAKVFRSASARAAWPTKDEMLTLVNDERLSDSQIGKRYGHSHEWARRVRKAYGIPAVPKPPHREIKHGRYIGSGKWSTAAKGENKCRWCNAPKRRRALHLHHVIPRSMCRATKTDLRNGIPLCFDCHQGWHDRRLVIYRDVFTQEEWDFLCAVQLLGQNVEYWLDVHYPDRGLPFREPAS